jgi:hypothetical protein
MVNPYVLYRIGKRLFNSIRAVASLALDRETVRSLPWPYLRRQVVANRWMLWQAIGIISALIVLPVASVMPDAIRTAAYVAVGAICLSAAFVPWLRRKSRPT